jgi:hypothetical protein
MDKSQDSNVRITGWGVDPVVRRNTMDDIKEMLKNHPLMKANKINYIEI